MEKSRAKGHHDLAEQLLCAICNLLVAQPDPSLSVTECCRIFEEVYIAEESSGTKVSAATASACQVGWESPELETRVLISRPISDDHLEDSRRRLP
jgi:hypothetical protein